MFSYTTHQKHWCLKRQRGREWKSAHGYNFKYNLFLSYFLWGQWSLVQSYYTSWLHHKLINQVCTTSELELRPDICPLTNHWQGVYIHICSKTLQLSLSITLVHGETPEALLITILTYFFMHFGKGLAFLLKWESRFSKNKCSPLIFVQNKQNCIITSS